MDYMMIFQGNWEQFADEIEGDPLIKWGNHLGGGFEGLIIFAAEGDFVGAVPGEMLGDGGAALHLLGV